MRVGLTSAKSILLWRRAPRDLALVVLRWLAAFTSGDAPGIFISRIGTSRSRLHSAAEQAAFEQLFLRYKEPLLDYLYGMTHEREIAEDLAQETFLRAYQAEIPLARVTHPQAWLYRIATNVALNVSRRRRHFTWLPLHTVELEVGPHEADSWSDPLPPTMRKDDFAVSIAERDAVWSVLAELPPRWRAVLPLQTTAGFGVREIGTLLHLEEGNVRKMLFRAKERFRAIYMALETDEAEGGQP
jgi:RNA polymerase sigma-70 factor (ECF subfamily)